MSVLPIRSAPPPRRQAAGSWQATRLLGAPHRLAFAAATALMMAATGWWALALLARTLGGPWPQALPPSTVHALLMTLGFMPLFFAGFLFTAGPRWLGLPPVPPGALLAGVSAQVVGWLMLLLATLAPAPLLGQGLGAAGVALAGSGWGLLVGRFALLVWRSRVPDRLHAGLAACAGGAGVLLTLAAAAALAGGDFAAVHALLRASLWVCIGVTFTVVAHRMLPFFSASALPALDAWRPNWLLWIFVGVLVFEGVAGAAPVAPALQAGVEAGAALLWLGLALRWGLLQSLKLRLLAMLHLGFFWLGITMALMAASHSLASLGGPSLGLAPLHAYSMGFLGSTLVAMATRVSAGHSGRALAVDNRAWALFWLLQAAVIARIMSELFGTPALWLPAVLWAAAVLPWGWRHLGWYGRPRADGRPD